MTNREVPGWRAYLETVGLIALATGACFAFRAHLQTTDVAMVYLLAVVAVAARHRQAAAVLASLLGIAAFDFLFVPPYYTFNVHNAAYFLTFGVMLAVGLVMSRLTARIREQADEARERERRTAALLALSSDLAEAEGLPSQVAVGERHLAQAVGGEAVLLVAVEGAPDWPTEGIFESLSVSVAAHWAHEHGEPAGMGTNRCAEAEALAVPLRTASRALGVAVVRPEPPRAALTPAECRMIVALADQVATSIERAIWTERHEQARLEVEAERLRTALLSSLSHDLRTPLASIEGAGSSLVHDADSLPQEVRRDLAETIVDESRRMTRLIANLLEMVRVETGGLAVRKSWQPLEEALGVALLRLEDRLSAHPVTVDLPDDLPLVPVDELLIEQVFLNLLENAGKYTAPGTAIGVSARVDDGSVVVDVSDCGPGVPAGDEEVIFRKFYRASGTDGAGGAGLGLTICRGIITAHGGRIWVESPPTGGARFRFTLPLDGPAVTSWPAEPAER